MSESRRHDRPSVSLEQLLKLKRSERPDAAFWDEFDRELRRRQLASVVAAPTWRARFARSLLVGLRRAVPVTAAAAAAIGGFLILQRPAEDIPAPVETAAAEPVALTLGSAAEYSTPAETVSVPEVASREPAAPVFVRPATSEPRFVVHEFAAATMPSRTFVSVTSPNTFSSSPDFEASLQTVNTLSSGSARRTSANPAAGNF